MEKSTRFVTYLATVLQFRVNYENYTAVQRYEILLSKRTLVQKVEIGYFV